MRKLSLISSLCAIFATGVAEAREVHVSWKAIKKAAGYELKIDRKGKTVRSEKAQKSSWSGDLPFGLYAYQVRAIDRIGRPGHWSGVKPLAVMPDAPKLVSPKDGEALVYFDPSKRAKLTWREVPDVSHYEVELFSGDKVVLTSEVHGTELELPAQSKGAYAWQVRPVMEPGTVPDFRGKKWRGKPGERFEYRLDYKQLEAPEPLSPVGGVQRARGEQVDFQWKEVEGAEAYEVSFAPIQGSGEGARRPAAEAFRKVTTPETHLTADQIPDGSWTWQVRALAAVDPKTEDAAVKGGESASDFQLETASLHPDGRGFVAFSLMLAPYTYQVTSSELQGTSNASATSMNYRLSGEYWPSTAWGAQLGLNEGFMIANSQTISSFDWDLYAKHQFTIGPEGGRWFIQPKIGVLSHQYPHLLVGTATSGFQVSDQVRATGFGAGVDVRHAFTERLSLGLKFEYFVPVGITADNGGGVLYAQDSYRNVSLGIQAIYWLGGPWGVGAGAFLEDRSIGYRPVGSNGVSANPELIRMDGQYFFGSVIYSWGR